MSTTAQTFDLNEGVPPLPEDMANFYRQLIPVACKSPEQLAAAKAALKARDAEALSQILGAWAPVPAIKDDEVERYHGLIDFIPDPSMRTAAYEALEKRDREIVETLIKFKG